MQFDVKKITLLDKLCEESVKNVGEKKTSYLESHRDSLFHCYI